MFYIAAYATREKFLQNMFRVTHHKSYTAIAAAKNTLNVFPERSDLQACVIWQIDEGSSSLHSRYIQYLFDNTLRNANEYKVHNHHWFAGVSVDDIHEALKLGFGDKVLLLDVHYCVRIWSKSNKLKVLCE